MIKIITKVSTTTSTDTDLEHVMWSLYGGRHLFQKSKEEAGGWWAISEVADDADLKLAERALTSVSKAKTVTCEKI